MAGEMAETVLVADGDPDILRFVEVNLRLQGYEVSLAQDGEEALRVAVADPPALVILDLMLPRVDGLEVCRRLRASTSYLPIIILAAKASTVDKVVGLAAGADDYVLKPFDPEELAARVRSTLRRTQELRTLSPLTGMPGNHRIRSEIARWLGLGEPLALIYADLNDFKSYNDHYGFLRGDEVIRMAGRVLQSALDRYATSESFSGHIGGDDFMLLCHPQDVVAVCEGVIEEFDSRIPSLYHPEDAERGYLEVVDRQRVTQQFPLVSIALGVATNERRTFRDPREMVETATEMKSYLKHTGKGSGYAVDGRTDADALEEPMRG